jgi:hypothetical protein
VIWNLRGHVTVRVVSNAGVNAVVSGLFFGGSAPPPNPTASAAFVGTDAATQGSWKGVYGSDGYNVVNDAISYPAYAQVAPADNRATRGRRRRRTCARCRRRTPRIAWPRRGTA